MSLEIYLEEVKPVNVYEANITNNLVKMADVLGVYDIIWAADGEMIGDEMIKPLAIAIHKLKDEPYYYDQYEAPNEWGTVSQFTKFLEQLLEACIEHPNSIVKSTS